MLTRTCELQSAPKADWREQLILMRATLMRSAWARLRNEDLAREAVASVMLAALEHPPKFEDPSRIRTWLLGMLRHKLLDLLRLRDRQREHHYGLDPHAADSGLPIDAIPHVDPGPEQILLGRHFMGDLDAALSTLPTLHRHAFLFCHVLGEETEAACAALGISPNHLGVCLHRARVRLRQILILHAA